MTRQARPDGLCGRDRPPCFPRFTEFIDFFVLNDAARAMKAAGAFQEVRFTQGPAASDHCPIVIELAP